MSEYGVATQSAEDAKLDDVVAIYEINTEFAKRLKQLRSPKTEIVLLCDDSGSMRSQCRSGKLGMSTRWNELKSIAGITLSIAAAMDDDGVDVYFLNRPALKNVTNDKDPRFVATFNSGPNGYTPLTRVLNQIVIDKASILNEGTRLLILIATDGLPTNDYGEVQTSKFYDALQTRHPNVYTTILACTDDEDTMSYLNGWDKQIPRLDVVDDYAGEKKEILAVQGQSFPFSMGDYVVKSLLGSIDKWFDALDEHKVERFW